MTTSALMASTQLTENDQASALAGMLDAGVADQQSGWQIADRGPGGLMLHG